MSRAGLFACLAAALAAGGCRREPSGSAPGAEQEVGAPLPEGARTSGASRVIATTNETLRDVTQTHASSAPVVKSNAMVYADEDYGFKVAYPGENWKRGGPGTLLVAGELCRVWSAPHTPAQVILVVVHLRQEPITAEALMQELSQQFAQEVKAKVEHAALARISGLPAVSLLVSGMGAGSGMDGRGSIPTRQRWISVPRGREVIHFLASGPASDFTEVNQVFEAMALTLQVDATRPPARTGSRLYLDKEYGITVAYPEPLEWIRGGPEPGGVIVPGELCRAWSSATNRAELIALFVQKTGIPSTPRYLLDSSVDRLRNQAGVEVVDVAIVPVAEKTGMSMVITGLGTGAALDGKGTVHTTQQWVAIPREQDVVVFLANGPADTFPNVSNVLSGMLRSLRLIGEQTKAQRESK